MSQAKTSHITVGALPPITTELLLIGLLVRTMGPKARARFEAELAREATAVKVVPLRGARPSVNLLTAYQQAETLAQRLGAI